MIEHLVLFRFKPGVATSDAAVQSVHRAMQELPGQIGGICEWHCGFNATPDELAWDYALSARFDDEQALHAYFEHPRHAEVLELWAPIAELRFCDLAL